MKANISKGGSVFRRKAERKEIKRRKRSRQGVKLPCVALPCEELKGVSLPCDVLPCGVTL